MKYRSVISVIAFSLLATIPAWGQTSVIKRTPSQQPAKVKTGPQWKWKGDYHEGLAYVKDYKDKYGFVDQSGKLVIPCKWGGSTSFSEGLAWVMDKGNYKYILINKQGKIVK